MSVVERINGAVDEKQGEITGLNYDRMKMSRLVTF